MQLTDAEIREILIMKKREKRRRQRRRRRITLLLIILLLIIIIVIIKFHSGSAEGETVSKPIAPPRGTIFIDPGHGGGDPGSGNGARYEKDDTLRLALAVKEYLEESNFTVLMSRTGDEEVDRAKRGKMAVECGAKLMVSIHRNKASGGGEGVEAFIPSSDDPSSRLLAENIISALVEQGFAERTVRAGTLQSTEDDYDELASATMPACLVEVGFISNDGDNKRFDNNLDLNAQAIAQAIDKTFTTLYETEEDAENAEEGSQDSEETTEETESSGE